MQNKNTESALIRWGIIGCGSVTELKSGPAYQKTACFELSAVMRRDLSLAADYAKRHKVKAYSSNAADIINNDDIDAVYIATPPDSHKLYALQVAAAGKPCCIEKPLAPSYADSLAIVNAFEAQGVPLFVAYYRRSLPRFNKVKALLESGEMGEIRTINAFLNKPANALDLSGELNWRTDKTVAAGGYFDDLASHGLDLFAYLLGEFDVVKGLGTNQQGLYSSLDAVTACWQHKSGVTGIGSWNFGGCTREDRVVITGSKGEISFSVFDEAAIVLQTLNQRQEFTIDNPENIQLHHVANIREQLLNDVVHPSSGKTALHTSWVMEQILHGG
ncbi:Gfo/Idh/MocA family protein [Moritella sp. F3]|uniref:Gfo/Idh/MocA family protein n=1 Tax=Moritella sp. F3 TaxID=2718882 RepID=UPI0018E0ECE1|nr:Gfo/Idh/MocA family oxidoreductase [Moritella sp. F3]GIC78658.1 oxidoreductase [Moritella sp. F1]GIC81414.1 oxidoreductase [Moritella sp. F3]